MDFMFGLPVPPEMQEHIRQQQAHHEMTMAARQHELEAFFKNLSKDDLLTARRIFTGLAMLPKSETRVEAARLESIAATHLKLIFDVCAGCGENHDQQALKDMLADGRDESSPHDDAPYEPETNPGIDKINLAGSQVMSKGAVQDSLFPDPRTVPAELMPEDIERMEKYNLDDMRDEDTLQLIGFVCKGCGARYQSIEDRALRPVGVEGCNGCQQKAKWG